MNVRAVSFVAVALLTLSCSGKKKGEPDATVNTTNPSAVTTAATTAATASTPAQGVPPTTSASSGAPPPTPPEKASGVPLRSTTSAVASGGAAVPPGSPPPDGKYERVIVDGVTVPMINVMEGGKIVLVDTDGKKPRSWEEQYKRKRPELPTGHYDLHKTNTNKNDTFEDDAIDKEGLWVIDAKGNITKR